MDLWSPKRPLYQLSHSHQGTFLPEFVFVRNFSKQADVGRQMVLMESQIGKTRIKISLPNGVPHDDTKTTTNTILNLYHNGD